MFVSLWKARPICNWKVILLCTFRGRSSLFCLSSTNFLTSIDTTSCSSFSFKPQVAWIGKMRWHQLQEKICPLLGPKKKGTEMNRVLGFSCICLQTYKHPLNKKYKQNMQVHIFINHNQSFQKLKLGGNH